MHRLLAVMMVALPAVALAKRSSSYASSSPDAQAAGIVGGILIIVLFIVVAAYRSKTTIKQPDGTTTEYGPFSRSSSSSTSSEPPPPKKRLVGPTTMSFPTVAARSNAVEHLKEKYGSAIHFVHRGSVQQRDWAGLQRVYTLVMEVPVKCPECGETYAVDDFGFTDCPSCGKELAVYFDQATRKRKVGIARDGKVYEPERKTSARTPRTLPELKPESLPASPEEAIEARFTKIK
ncbi:MAG TPA: TFIIB-type zinc ribbon-containing protein [Anaeromyxobacter sp.]|nr:TFIIB-type zinc ribbon-containing protein [Anaeromyxobacter sp.]